MKISKYIQEEFNNIIKDSREYQAYELGLSIGNYGFYKYIVAEYGIEVAEKMFEEYLCGNNNYNKYFRKLIEIDKENEGKDISVLEKKRELFSKLN